MLYVSLLIVCVLIDIIGEMELDDEQAPSLFAKCAPSLMERELEGSTPLMV